MNLVRRRRNHRVTSKPCTSVTNSIAGCSRRRRAGRTKVTSAQPALCAAKTNSRGGRSVRPPRILRLRSGRAMGVRGYMYRGGTDRTDELSRLPHACRSAFRATGWEACSAEFWLNPPFAKIWRRVQPAYGGQPSSGRTRDEEICNRIAMSTTGKGTAFQPCRNVQHQRGISP
jgi:hypothetical protein